MTRNEWITARVAARLDAGLDASTGNILLAAQDLEARGIADWQPAPAASDDEATAILRRMVSWLDYNGFRHISVATEARAHLVRKDAK